MNPRASNPACEPVPEHLSRRRLHRLIQRALWLRYNAGALLASSFRLMPSPMRVSGLSNALRFLTFIVFAANISEPGCIAIFYRSWQDFF